MAIRRFLWAFGVVFLFMGGSAQPQPVHWAPEDTFGFLPGVVIDRSHPTAYLMNPSGGIDAVDLTSGVLLWSSREAAKPLLVYGDLLVTQTEPVAPGTLGIAFLRRSDGTLRLATDLPLPEGVMGRIADGPGTRFDVWAAARQGQISIGWESIKRWAKPVPPGPRDSIETRLEGGFLMDLSSKATPRIAAPPPRPARPIPRLATDDSVTGEKLYAGGVFAATRMVRNPGSQRLVLQRWSAGNSAPLEEMTLFAGDYHLRLPSADGQHLMVSRKTASGSGDGYTFLVFSLATGKLLGEVENPRSHAFFFVLGSTLVSESLPFAQRAEDEDDKIVFQPRKIRAINLAKGAVLWERPVRDTAYRGPYPP